MANDFDQCGDSCGWIAAIVAALAYGSFGVPVKYTKHIPVHPLVLQSYKTVVVFLTCWFVMFLGVKPSFTKWGVLSGFLWVIGGTGGALLLSFSSDGSAFCPEKYYVMSRISQESTASEWLDWRSR